MKVQKEYTFTSNGFYQIIEVSTFYNNLNSFISLFSVFPQLRWRNTNSNWYAHEFFQSARTLKLFENKLNCLLAAGKYIQAIVPK